MSDPNWADSLTGIGTAVLAAAAVYAALAWRGNLRGTTKHQTAARVLEEARLFRYLFYDARNPFYPATEFPAGYYSNQNPSNAEKASAWRHIYQGRWHPLNEQMFVLAKLRARAGALLSEDVATAIEDLARKGRELHGFMEDRIEQIREGEELVQQWPDQEWVGRVKASVTAAIDPKARDDRYSQEFESEFAKLEDLVRPFV